MAIADKVTSITNHLIADYEELENIGAELENVDKNIENIASCLEEVYNNIPKTTDTGTNLSLNTIKGKMNIIPKGDTYQYTTTGKNKIPYPYTYDTRTVNGITFTVNTNGTINVNGTATANATFVIQNQATASGLRELLLNNNCFLSGCPSGGSSSAYMQLYGYSSSGTGAKADIGNGISVAGFENENNNFNIAIVILSGTTVNNLLFAPQLEIGSSKTPWEPYTNGASPNPTYPQNIEVVTGTQEVKVENVNLAPLNEADFTTTFYGVGIEVKDQVVKISGTPTDNISIMIGKNGVVTPTNNDRITFQLKSGTYKFTQFITGSSTTNVDIRIKDENTNVFYRTGETITLSETHTFSINILILGTDNKNAEITIQLEKGSTATTYTPHQEQTQTISLGDIELCKIGNYQDYLYKSGDKWYKKAILYKIANKTNWNVSSMGTNNRAVISLNGNGFPYSSDIGYAIANAVSNNLIGISQLNQASTTEINNVAINNSNMYIKFADTINTTALVKTQLDSMTSLEVYYVVATPNDIQITNETLIEQLNNLEKAQSYNGITNISSNGNLPIVLGVSALKGE